MSLVVDAAFDADTLLTEAFDEVMWLEVVAWAKTVADFAPAEAVLRAVGFVFHTTHTFVAEGADEVIGVPVC